MPRPTCIVCGFDSGGGPLCEFDAKTYPQVARVIAERDRLIDELADLRKRYMHVSDLNHNQVSMVRAYAKKAEGAQPRDNHGQPFEYDTEPLPLLNPELV